MKTLIDTVRKNKFNQFNEIGQTPSQSSSAASLSIEYDEKKKDSSFAKPYRPKWLTPSYILDAYCAREKQKGGS